ncbi:MAG: hypothetical protein IJ688_00400 [Treponema sp.]|nr:hypothetical protein [Treponema sp.]
MNKNDVTLNYAFQEYIPEKKLNERGIKGVSKILTYEEPRWTLKDTASALKIIKEADSALYETIQSYIREQHLPSENTLQLDFGKSLRYDDEYIGDFSKETLSDKLDNRFIVRYSHDNDEGNLIDGGDEIIINDKELVSLFNGMIEGHVKENIQKYDEYKIKREASQKNEVWTWKDYDDLSGHLVAPDGKSYFSYDWTTKEYKVTPDSAWDSFLDADPTRDTSLTAFKEYAQKFVKENIVRNRDIKIIFERDYIDTEKLLEEEEKRMAKSETLADKYNRMEKLFEDKLSHLGSGDGETFKELCKWVEEEFPEKDSEGVLLEATSRMIEENLDFGEFNYQAFDDIYGFGDGAEWRLDFSDSAAKELLSGEIVTLSDAQSLIWEKAEKEFAVLKENPQYKDEIEITDRINSAFRIADRLYPELKKEFDGNHLLADEFPQYSNEEKKTVINNAFEKIKYAFDEKKVRLSDSRTDELVFEGSDKWLLLGDFKSLIKGKDAAEHGKESLFYIRPNEEQLHDGIENGWEFDEITTGYAIFQNPDLDVKGGFTPKFISKVDDMNVFKSDGDAAKQYGIDHNCRILEEKKDIWIGDENLEYYSYPDIPENHRIMEENGWLLKQPLEFDFSEFTEKDFNRIRDELFKDNPKEDYYGRLHIGSIHVEFVINQQDGWVDTNYYILGQKGEGETQFGVPYDHFPGHQIASNLFTDNTYEDFKEMVTKAVLDDIAEETSLKPEAMRPLVDWNDEQQCNELYHTKLVEAARLNEIVIAPYSRERRDIEAVRDFIAGLESVPALEIEDNKVFAVIDNIGKEQTHEPGDFLKIRKNGTVEHISSLGPVEKEPVEVLHIINSFAEDHASVSENGSQQRNDYEYTNSLYEKVYENYIKEPSVDSYKQSLKDIQEQIEKESGIKVDEKVSDEIYSRYKDHDLTLKRNENGSFRVIDDVDGKYTNPLSLQYVVRQVIAWDDKELSELHPGTADDETITKINGYIEKLEHINEKIIERSKEEEKLVNEEKLPLDYDTIKELPDAHEEDIKKYCNIHYGMNIDDKTAIEINDFYWNNDNPLYLHKSPAGNLYVINDLGEEVKQADGEIMVNASRFRQMDEENQFEYIKNNFDDENFDEMLEQLGEGRVQVISDALARSFATLDKHEDLWRKLLEKGANPERSIKVVAEDANLGDNLNWLLDNIDKTELKNIFSDNGYADSVFEIAKESVTNDIGSWKTGSDISFEGFMRIAKLCDREIDAERYYGKVLEKAFEKPVEPAIYGLLDSPERLEAYMNNHRISSNEPTISVEQAADILRYSCYEDYKFYTSKEGNAYILDVSEDYSGEGSRANNFDILTLAHDMAEKALDEEYHDYTEESYKRLDSLYKTYRHHFNPETNLSFTDDIDKMRDFDSLSKDEFLSSYGYLTEEEYDATAKELKEHDRTGLQTVKALAYKNVMDKNYLAYDNRLEKSGSEADKIQSAIERLTDVSLPAVAGEIGKSEQDVAEIISALLDAKDYVEERFNVVRPTADEIIEKVRDEVSWADILKTELSWKDLGLNPEDYDRAESGTETEKDFKEWAMGLELENTLDLHGFDTALEGVSSWNNSTISEQKWMIIDKLSEEIVSGKLKIENSQDAFDKLLKENEVYKDFVQKGIVKDDAFGLREISEKEPVDIIKEIATQKELAEVPELFTREFKNRMKTHFPGPERDPFIVAKAIINDWKTSKPDHIPALNKWLSDSLKEEGFSTKENLEKGFEKFFKKLSSFEQKRMQHKDSDIGQGR